MLRQFAEQQERRHSAAAKPKPAPLKKAMTITTQAPSLSKQNRSKSMDVRPPALNRVGFHLGYPRILMMLGIVDKFKNKTS